jgi:hypothetical protein
VIQEQQSFFGSFVLYLLVSLRIIKVRMLVSAPFRSGVEIFLLILVSHLVPKFLYNIA